MKAYGVRNPTRVKAGCYAGAEKDMWRYEGGKKCRWVRLRPGNGKNRQRRFFKHLARRENKIMILEGEC